MNIYLVWLINKCKNLYQENQVINVFKTKLDLTFVLHKTISAQPAIRVDTSQLLIDTSHPLLCVNIPRMTNSNNDCLLCENFWLFEFSLLGWSGSSLNDKINFLNEVFYVAIDIILLKMLLSRKFPRWCSPKLKSTIHQKKMVHGIYKKKHKLL